MKRLLLIALSLTNLCFAKSMDVDANVRAAWKSAQEGSCLTGIGMLSVLINDPNISDVDKIHYINSRAVFYHFEGFLAESSRDRLRLAQMCEQSSDCLQEYENLDINPFFFCPIPGKPSSNQL
jgi:hypothetical protein